MENRHAGKGKRGIWRKLNLSVNADTQEIVAEVLAENRSHDSQAVPAMLGQIDQLAQKFYGDGG